MKNREKAKKAFSKELAFIRSEDVRTMVLDIFEKVCPDYFFTAPASMSGRYHPDVSRGKHGLIRHTRLTVYIALELMHSKPVSEDMSDAIVAACIIHDLIKNGAANPLYAEMQKSIPGHMTGKHGLVLHDIVRQEFEGKYSSDTELTLLVILNAIKYHMGIWTDGPDGLDHEANFLVNKEYLPTTIVHLADYIASRKLDGVYEKLMTADYEEMFAVEPDGQC